MLARYSTAARQAAAGNEAVAEVGAARERQQSEVAERRLARNELAVILPGLREGAAAAQVRMTELRERLAGLREASGREAAHLASVERQRDEAAADLERAARAVGELAVTVAALAAEAAEVAREREAGTPPHKQLAASDEAAATDLAAAQALLREAVGRSAEAAARDEAARARVAALQDRLALVRHGLDELPALDAARTRLAEGEARAEASRGALEQAKAVAVDANTEFGVLAPAREARRAKLLAAEQAAAECRERLAAEESRLREVRAAVVRLTERRAALDRGLARLAERRSTHESRAELLAGQGGDGEVEARESELAIAESALVLADGVLDQARETLSAAEHARTEVAAELRGQRRSADALEAEIRVLESLAPPASEGGLLDRIEVPADLMAALAAALGDDLLAGTEAQAPRYWLEPPGIELASLPTGSTPLLQWLRAPALLSPRLAQIGLIEAELASAAQALLKPGQRLVSRDGGLWRWNGFVTQPRRRRRCHCPRAPSAAPARGARGACRTAAGAGGAGGSSRRGGAAAAIVADRVG